MTVLELKKVKKTFGSGRKQVDALKETDFSAKKGANFNYWSVRLRKKYIANNYWWVTFANYRYCDDKQ